VRGVAGPRLNHEQPLTGRRWVLRRLLTLLEKEIQSAGEVKQNKDHEESFEVPETRSLGLQDISATNRNGRALHRIFGWKRRIHGRRSGQIFCGNQLLPAAFLTAKNGNCGPQS